MSGSKHSPVAWFLACGAMLAAGILPGCGGGSEKPPTASIEATQTVASGTDDVLNATTPAASPAKPAKKPAVDPIVLVRTNAGSFKVQLFAEKAPQTVDNFLRNYVDREFYTQTVVHHVDPSMVLMGGFDASLQPKETRAEIYNESANGLKNERGTVAMARSPDVPHSATSQFFVNLADNPGFDYQETDEGEVFGYCVFGKVVEGMEIVERIGQMSTNASGDFPSVPTPLVVIESVEQVR